MDYIMDLRFVHNLFIRAFVVAHQPDALVIDCYSVYYLGGLPNSLFRNPILGFLLSTIL